MGRANAPATPHSSPPTGPSILALIALAMLSGCTPKLPSCLPASPSKIVKPSSATPTSVRPPDTVPPAPARDVSASTDQLIIGIDGSGSMAGHARAADPSAWRSLLQSVNLSAETLSLRPQAFRIGGGNATQIPTGSANAASNPCFFEGCSPFKAVSSSLQTLWQLPSPGQTTPLRLLISDLEVNEGDISTLIAGIKSDLAKGAGAGILALKLPFTGPLYNTQAQPFWKGSVNRPVYLLATGPSAQVKALLEEIRKIMAQKGVQSQEISLFGEQNSSQSLTARDAQVIPPDKGAVGLPIQLGTGRFSPVNNGDYRFIHLRPGATGFSVMTTKPWSGGTIRPDLGLVRLERIPLTPGESTSSNGVRIRRMLVAGSHLRLDFDVLQTTPSGALRATITTMPEQWWIDWDRERRKDAKPEEKATTTEGLLLLLSTLSSQIREARGAPPAATLCMAFQTTP